MAIVTGGGAVDDGIGNGRAAAILLARAGAMCWCVDRDLALVERTVEMLAAEGGNAVSASYDVTSSAQCAAMVEDAVGIEAFRARDPLAWPSFAKAEDVKGLPTSTRSNSSSPSSSIGCERPPNEPSMPSATPSAGPSIPSLQTSAGTISLTPGMDPSKFITL